MRYMIEAKPPLYDIQHSGVKGMKWGVRREERRRLRTLDRESRSRDKIARDKEIDAARERYNESFSKSKQVRAQYKIDKKKIGRREAKKKVIEFKAKQLNDYEIGNMMKSGKETTAAVLTIIGSVAVAAAIGAARSR